LRPLSTGPHIRLRRPRPAVAILREEYADLTKIDSLCRGFFKRVKIRVPEVQTSSVPTCPPDSHPRIRTAVAPLTPSVSMDGEGQCKIARSSNLFYGFARSMLRPRGWQMGRVVLIISKWAS